MPQHLKQRREERNLALHHKQCFGSVLTRSVMQENEVNLLQEAASWLLQLKQNFEKFSHRA